MATVSKSYDAADYTMIRQESKASAVGAAVGIIHGLTFRSRVAAVVTGIGAVLESASGSGSLILTLLIDGSVAAILTLSNSANEVARSFTLTANRTIADLTGRIQVGTPTHVTGAVAVVYEYRIVPGSDYSVNAAIA
jgi:hypothetical protein